MLKQQKGITLVALVITIVVLIILATVAISLSLNQNGLFTKAQDSTHLYSNAERYEQEQANTIDTIVNDALAGL